MYDHTCYYFQPNCCLFIVSEEFLMVIRCSYNGTFLYSKSTIQTTILTIDVNNQMYCLWKMNTKKFLLHMKFNSNMLPYIEKIFFLTSCLCLFFSSFKTLKNKTTKLNGYHKHICDLSNTHLLNFVIHQCVLFFAIHIS